MAEKGGKGSLPPRGGKSAQKSPVENSDSSAKTKKGRKVHFDSEDSLEDDIHISNGKANTPAAKGGKGDKTANGTQKPAGKLTNPLEREIPLHSTCLMDCEVAEILQGIQDQMVVLSQDPDIKLPVSFDAALTYAKRGGTDIKAETVKKILDPLKKHGASDCEICLIANICPETVDEVFALIPALKPKMSKLRDPLRIALEELANLKAALASLKDST